MTITRDELKSLKYEDIINKIKEAVKREDKEFIMSIIPLFDHFAEEAADKGRDIYGELKDYLEDSEIIKDRNIALKLAEYGYAVPEDLYENDEAIIFAMMKSGNVFDAIDLPSRNLRNDEDFIERMLDTIEDIETLHELQCFIKHDKGFTFPINIEKLIANRMSELKKKSITSSHDDTPSSYEGISQESTVKNKGNSNVVKKIEAVKRTIIERIGEKQGTIKKQKDKIKGLINRVL